MGFPPLRKTISPHVKNYDNFSRVFEIANQLPRRHSLYLAPSMNGNAFSKFTLTRSLNLLTFPAGRQTEGFHVLDSM